MTKASPQTETPPRTKARTAAGRIGLRLARLVEKTGIPRIASNPKAMRVLSYLPPVPVLARSERPVWPEKPWLPILGGVPQELRTVPGVRRDEEEADRAFVSLGPLPLWSEAHAQPLAYLRNRFWKALLPLAPRVMRAYRRLNGQDPGGGSAEQHGTGSAELSARLHEAAREVGLSAIGVAPYDPRYTFAPYIGEEVGDRVIVCLLEQDWEATQTIPSLWAEQVVQRTYGELTDAAFRLARMIRDWGYRAVADAPFGTAASIHYGVQAGLGQLGLNGQLLTPFAGSRVRLVLIRTDAPFGFDQPQDFGLEGICDACRSCVRRCPVSAIPARRSPHRGVLKAKINSQRCLPTVAQTEGCGICMKVCPVQRYGLKTVLEGWRATGQIPGVNTDELEGYVWPLDGKFYGPKSRPAEVRSPEFLSPPDLDLSSFFDEESAATGKTQTDELNLPAI